MTGAKQFRAALAALSIDFHVAATLILRGWTICAGAGTVIFIPIFLSKSQQGYYFTFASVIGLQIFFELGFNYIITLFVAQRHSPERRLATKDDRANAAQLADLTLLSRRFYSVSALLFLLVCGTGGAYFFSSTGDLPRNSWIGSWCAVVTCTSVNLFLSPYLAIYEGHGYVGDVARMRTLASMLGYSAMWLGLYAGFGLNAIPLVSLSSALCAIAWLYQKRAALDMPSFQRDSDYVRLRWRKDIFPLQWRITLSWISGYFLFQLFNPLIFSFHGSHEAGRVGLALGIYTALLTLSMSWINAKGPSFARMAGNGQIDALNASFKKSFVAAAGTNLALVLIATLVIIAARGYVSGIAERIASGQVLVCIAFVTVANQAIFSMAVYMRSYREEPMLLPSVVGASVTGAVSLWLVRYGIFPMMLAYASITVLILLPWTFSLYHSRRRARANQ